MASDVGGVPLQRNAILRALPHEELDRVSARMEPVQMEVKSFVYRPGEAIEHLYFPLGSVFSFVAHAGGEATVEVGTIGPEGVVGLPVFLGGRTSPHEAFCQVPGPTLRLSATALHEVLVGDGSLRRQLNRYTQAMIVQLAQNVACNRAHTARQRASRWLLMTADRVGGDTFPLTQEFLAQMLGVRRAGVNEAQQALQDAGLIDYSRGVVTVVDRAGLQARACECYGIIRDEHERLAGFDPAPSEH